MQDIALIEAFVKKRDGQFSNPKMNPMPFMALL
jgi:hypothetical protein